MSFDEPRRDIQETIAELERPFEAQAIKQRDGGGGRRYDYVETQTVIRRLNQATNNNWTFTLGRLEQHGDLWLATGHLTIPGLGTRPGIGVQRVSERSGEDLIKGATSDCLKNCARMFGVALDLYGPDYESGEVAPPARPTQPAQRPAQRAPSAPPRQPEPPPADASGPRLTQPQLGAIYAIGKRKGLNPDGLRDVAKTDYHVEQLEELTSAQASGLITKLQAIE